MNELTDFLVSQDVEYKRNEKLSEKTSIGIGGIANLLILPKSKEELVNLLVYLSKNNFKYRVVGNMTNLLPCDAVIETVIVSTLRINKIHVSGSAVFAECGALFSKIISAAAKESAGGAEALFGIPGSVGGMLSLNAGAYGKSVSDFLSEVIVYDPSNNEEILLKKSELAFYYRDSEIKRRMLTVLEARFNFQYGAKSLIYEKISETKRRRKSTQPIGSKTLGSVFKRSESYPASYLIDLCGLKGMRIGGILVSEKHAGFFINEGGGTARDFLELAQYVKNKVKENFGIELNEEFELLD